MQYRRTLLWLSALLGVEANSFGNYFSTGGVSSGNFIRQANTTLILPNAPNPVKNILSLWPGMGMSNGDLIQALAISYPGTNNGAACGTLGSNWCVCTSLLRSGDNYQTEGPSATAKPGDKVLISYMYSDSTNGYNQYVYVNGKLVSQLSSSVGGKAEGYGTAEECQPGTPCGTVPSHQYTDTVIVMNKADPNYINTVGKNGASGTLSTSDGGVTWRASTITINSFAFTTGA